MNHIIHTYASGNSCAGRETSAAESTAGAPRACAAATAATGAGPRNFRGVGQDSRAQQRMARAGGGGGTPGAWPRTHALP